MKKGYIPGKVLVTENEFIIAKTLISSSLTMTSAFTVFHLIRANDEMDVRFEQGRDMSGQVGSE